MHPQLSSPSRERARRSSMEAKHFTQSRKRLYGTSIAWTQKSKLAVARDPILDSVGEDDHCDCTPGSNLAAVLVLMLREQTQIIDCLKTKTNIGMLRTLTFV